MLPRIHIASTANRMAVFRLNRRLQKSGIMTSRHFDANSRLLALYPLRGIYLTPATHALQEWPDCPRINPLNRRTGILPVSIFFGVSFQFHGETESTKDPTPDLNLQNTSPICVHLRSSAV